MGDVAEEPAGGSVWKWWRRVRGICTTRRGNGGEDNGVVESIGGTQFVITANVANPRLEATGEFLAHCLEEDPPVTRTFVLDLETGCGVGAVIAAKYGAIVDAVDSRLHAVECARANAGLNRVGDRITFHHGDLYEPVRGRRFHRVLCNPPRALSGGRGANSEDPTAVVTRFASGLAPHLTPDGAGWLVLSSPGGSVRDVDSIRALGLDVTCVRTSERDQLHLALFELRSRE